MPRNRINLPRFNLKDANSKDETLIYLLYTYRKGLTVKYSTGRKVIPKYWTGKEAKVSLKHRHYKELNQHLARLKEHAISIAEQYPNIHPSTFRVKLSEQYNNQNTIGIPDLAQYIAHFIDKYNVSVTWKQHYESLQKKLIRFTDETATDLALSNINIEFRNQYIKWLYTSGVNSPNTVHKALQRIKTLLEYSSKESYLKDGVRVYYHSNTDHLSKNWLPKKSKSTKHFLEFDELEKLAQYEIPSSLRRVCVGGRWHQFAEVRKTIKDYFLLSCYTGLRVSDLKRFSQDNIFNEDGFSYIAMNTYKGRTRKSDTSVVIPIMPSFQKFLDNFEFPKMAAEQTHNEYIKDICKEAGLDRKVLHKTFDKGQMNDNFVSLYSKITNHTGRYTFINIMINHYDIDILRVQKMTGQSLKVLQEYERGDKKKSAKKVFDSIISRTI